MGQIMLPKDEEKRLIVVLTGRFPVSIVIEDWPLIAEVIGKDDECGLSVRKNKKDGRLLIYGYSSDIKAGTLLDGNTSEQVIVSAIEVVASNVERHLANRCIALLPPVKL